MSPEDRTYVREGRPLVDHLAVQRLDAADRTTYANVLFEQPIGETPPPGVPVPMRERTRSRRSVIAAIEQFTAVLGTVREGLPPAWREPGAAIPRCPRRSYHPSQEGSPRETAEYPATSPAGRAAAGATGCPALARPGSGPRRLPPQ